MRKSTAATASALFLLAGPGTVAGLIPYLLNRWRPRPPHPLRPLARTTGALLITAGLALLTQAFHRFAGEGSGTPAPAAPPAALVTGGVYRHVRNPMYLALIAITTGQALIFAGPWTPLYAALLTALTTTYVRHREEPALRRRFGPAYDRYRRNVPAWIPRPTPWNPT
ncbi:methyltransferase family protein [Nocardiopsis potens]|uniref:methyltransferase family protein n=1 Tax=Nocardiopsis potens TaxID=1246458 RepID=UPI0003492A6D|nr:isoprenylcysteine carboxylmethyltransferase family protein [Nocardiopsis potens]